MLILLVANVITIAVLWSILPNAVGALVRWAYTTADRNAKR